MCKAFQEVKRGCDSTSLFCVHGSGSRREGWLVDSPPHTGIPWPTVIKDGEYLTGDSLGVMRAHGRPPHKDIRDGSLKEVTVKVEELGK